MPTHEARMGRIVNTLTGLIFLFFVLSIVAETYWNAVKHGASQVDRYDIRGDIGFNRQIIVEQRKEIDTLKAAIVELQAETSELRTKADGARK